jgi:hypothetical protein
LKKNPVSKKKIKKIKDVNSSIKSTRQMRTQVDTTTQRKNKSKQSTEISGKDLMQKRTRGYEMTINDNK